MKRKITVLTFFIFTVAFCFAQGPVSKNGNAVASSVIRVSIPSYAVIDLAKNHSKSVAYNTSTGLKDVASHQSQTKVIANDKWAVNTIREQEDMGDDARKPASNPSYTVIYVTTRM